MTLHHRIGLQCGRMACPGEAGYRVHRRRAIGTAVPSDVTQAYRTPICAGNRESETLCDRRQASRLHEGGALKG